MSDIAIRVENLGKAYRIGLKEQEHETLLGAFGAFVRAPFENFKNVRNLTSFKDADGDGAAPSDLFWALKGVSFDVKHGEVLAVIGRNGAGKSTLLKILSRIMEPTRGTAKIYGRVGSLLEVGTGFHPDLTGRENVYLNGTILGMKKREVDAKFDEIVDFSGVEKFIDTPVKRYSSGMRVRLAFSVAAHLEPEILIIDEVLAVGDAEFQAKCMGKMGEVAEHGRTVLFVSHNMAAVQKLCPSSLILESGMVQFRGETNAAIGQYLNRDQPKHGDLSTRTDRSGTGDVRVTGMAVCDAEGRPCEIVQSGQAVTLDIKFETRNDQSADGEIIIHVYFTTMMAVPVFLCSSDYGSNRMTFSATHGSARCRIPRLPLVPGTYVLGIVTKRVDADRTKLDDLSDAVRLTVIHGDFFGTGRLPPGSAGVQLVDNFWETGDTSTPSIDRNHVTERAVGTIS